MNGWNYVKLETLCEILDYKRKPITAKDRVAGKYPYYGATGILDYIDNYIFEEPLILIGEDGAKWGAGQHTAFLAKGKYWVNNHAHVIRTIKELVSDNWLIYYLNFLDLTEYTTGLTVPKLNQAALRNIPIPLPSINEQQQIISILNKVFEVINKSKTNIERNLQNSKELFKSELYGIFDKVTKECIGTPLKDISIEFGRGKSKHRPRNDERLYDGIYPFIQTGDVRNANKFINNYSQTYNEVGLKQSKLWPKETICITIAANIAETAILNFDSCFPDSIIGLVVNPNKANLDYTYYALQYSKLTLQKLGKGSAQDNINLGTFENMRFPFPSLGIQQEIVNKLDALLQKSNQLQEHYQRKIDSLEELKFSILKKAFNGELKRISASNNQINKVNVSSNLSLTDLHAGIIALSFQRHEQSNNLNTFHHVKSEKIAHMIETHLGIDLGRSPIKDAAGPNDYPLKMKVESRAKKAGFFYVEQSGEMKNYNKGSQFDKLIEKTSNALGEYLQDVYNLIDTMAPMSTQQAEIVATVYAAWNNLLIDKTDITDEAIVQEAREDWHPQKLKIDRERFFKAIAWMREHNLVPTGLGKRVNKKS